MAAGTESIGLNLTVTVSGLTITNIISVVPPSEILQVIESKRVDLPGGVIVKVPALLDPGKGSIQQDFTHAGYLQQETIRKAKVAVPFVFTIPDDGGNTVITVSGFITENKTNSVEADKITEFETMIDFSGPQS